MAKFRTLKDVDFRNKRALVRVDLNVPLGKNLKVDKNEIKRIEAIIPTLKYLLKQKSKIILISHLGEPRGRRDKKSSLRSVIPALEKLLGKKILFSEQIIGIAVERKIKKMKFGDVLMLENIRFNNGEEKNDPKFAKNLARLGDIYINDAFAVSHREHASIVGIPKLLSSAAGFLLEKEIKELDGVLENPKRPLIAIMGGAKIETKIKVINKFLKIADKVLIGGALANTILACQGHDLGDSIVEKKLFKEVRKFIGNPKLFLPVDLKTKNRKALDIGPKTIKLFCTLIKNAKTIVWNGPMGLTEQKPFAIATKELIDCIARSKAYSIVGGGDTVAFINQIKKEKVFDHISTGGGAMLDYLANGTLPGIEALK